MQYVIYMVLILLLPSCHNERRYREFEPSNINAKASHPGIGLYERSLLNQIRKMQIKRGDDYQPRTKHLFGKQAKFTNRLFLETSPYLLQHAHNPVNWYPWGKEAFAAAKKLNRPILLSIGYSTCHWCHVMEEESFEDLEVAKAMNENYISIKVDREERPDIDAIYMAAVQAINGSGGWPMTVWLTPDKKPIYGATYIPARDGDRGTKTGFLTMLKHFKKIYDTEPEKINKSSNGLAEYIEKRLQSNVSSELPDSEILNQVVNYYKVKFDYNWGGLTGAPKFPSSLSSRLLLRIYNKTKKKDVLNMVETTLTKMAAGGMYDHIAGGFHRYSTDSKWLVPHFEKMLYDNALLSVVYTEAYQLTKNKEYSRVTTEILDYVLKEMTSPQGGFYSATDADSIGPKGHREEGYYFTWTQGELRKVLAEKEVKLFEDYYLVTSKGNFEKGRTILSTPDTLGFIAKRNNLSEIEARAVINISRAKLYNERNKRAQPIKDDKIITAWNGLMISAFANASFVLNEAKYRKAAVNAADFILNNLKKDGRLKRTYNNGEAKLNAYLDDYAFLIAGLIDLYEATSNIKWLKEAIALDKTLEVHYEDKTSGGYFMTSDDHEKLLAREKPSYDGAEPSGNSIQAMNLLRLHEFTTNDTYRKRAVDLFKSFSHTLKENPLALTEMLIAWNYYLDKAKEIIIVQVNSKDAADSKLISALKNQFVSNRIISIVKEGNELKQYSKVIPLLRGKMAIDGKTTAFVCERGVCKKPVNDVKSFLKQIE